MNSTRLMTTMTQPQPWTLPDSAAVWNAAMLYPLPTRLEDLAAGFSPISLGAMDDVALLNRIDTKYLLTTGQLLSALAHLQPDYWMLEVNGQRLNHYRTLYFDTPGFHLYQAHVNDRPERYKVRCREYIESHLSFLEVKHRTRKDRTIKDRICTSRPVMQISADADRWLRSVSPMNGGALEPKLWNTFTRLTLVSKQCCERVTLDIDLAFFIEDRRLQLSDIAIAEVKMDAARGTSPFLAQMRAQRIRQRGFSKYAVGIAVLYDQVKKNTLKPKMLMIEKMMKGSVGCD